MKVSYIISTKSNYIIPVALFLSSFLIYSYNLEEQPWHGDEINYLGWAANYIHLIKEKNFDNSCLISIDNCNLLYHIPAHGATYSPLRMILIGVPLGAQNEDHGNFYNWSCYWFRCYNPNQAPTIYQMSIGRTLSPIFGSLTIVILFEIGRILFNRFVGVIASLLFLFYDLWIWYSRTIMTEVHYVFFSMLALLLLLYSFRAGTPKIRYFISSSIAFGLGLTSKLLSVEFSVLFFCIILFMYLAKIEPDTAKKGPFFKIGISIFVFFVISGLSFCLTEPGFYQNPLKEISVMKNDMDNYNRDVWFIGYPTIHGIQSERIGSLIHYALLPSSIEHKIFGPSFNLNGNFGWHDPPTYSSVPLSIFFVIGFGSIISRMRTLKDRVSDALLLVWFASTFILTLLIARDFSLERYLLPFLISIIFIAAYGFWLFVKGIPYTKINTVFAFYFIFVHAVTALLSWQKIYFSPGTTWFNPLLFGTLQQTFENPLTYALNMIFVGFFFYMLVLKFKKKSTPITQ